MTTQIKGQVLVYSIIGCPFCIRAKSKLDQLGLPYTDVNLDSNVAARNQMIELTGKKTVPQIFFNEIHIGGFQELKNLPPEELDRLIVMVREKEAPPDAPRPPKPMKSEKTESDDLEFTCELDEYAAIVRELKESGVVRDIRQKLILHKNSFVGREAVDWLVSKKNLEREEALNMCSILIERHFGHSVKRKGHDVFKDDDTIYRLLEDTESNALNAGLRSDCEPRSDNWFSKGLGFIETIVHYTKIVVVILLEFLWEYSFFLTVPLNVGNDMKGCENKHVSSPKEQEPMFKALSATEVGEELRRLILSLYGAHLSKDGTKVDYEAINQSDKFKAYVKHTAELHRVVLTGISREEKVAFFLNIYNALVIHAFVTVGPPINLWQRYKFFNVVSYIIGGHIYSLNEIENGVLRANRKPIGSFRKPFQKTDPRLAIALSKPEPRIHFALVCGAKSCPPIKTYSAKGLDEQLTLATEAFLESDSGCQVDVKKREVKLSQILKWYKEDFGSSKEEIVRWVYEHISVSEKKSALKVLMQLGFKLTHMPYDWSLNSK